MTFAPKHRINQHNAVGNSPAQAGFTLIEMMVVVVILSIFAGMMTVSVGSTESRKNRAFYEHLIDSLSYVRLVSAERMQPMGLVLQPDNSGQVQPTIVALSNPYAHFEATAASNNAAKNSMELLAMSLDTQQPTMPSWVVEDSVTLPQLPPDVSIEVTAMDMPVSVSTQSANFSLNNSNASQQTPQLQPWFVGTDVPQALWFGTGEAAPVRIEVRHKKRLVGDAIMLMPDGRIKVGE